MCYERLGSMAKMDREQDTARQYFGQMYAINEKAAAQNQSDQTCILWHYLHFVLVQTIMRISTGSTSKKRTEYGLNSPLNTRKTAIISEV